MKKIHFISAICLLTQSVAYATDYPLTIDNCGYEQTFSKEPESIVSIGQSATEILYELGQANKIKGTAVWFTKVNDKYADIDKSIERLAENTPSFEAVLSKHPDFVVSQYDYYIGKKGAVATREQFSEAGINTYLLPTDCMGKDNSSGVDGTRARLFSPTVLYKTIEQLSQIVNAEAQGKELIEQLKNKEKLAKSKSKQYRGKDLSVVFWYSSPDDKSDAWVAGKYGVSGYLSNLLGLHNIIQSDEEWPYTSWETIAKANPTFIVVAKMDRRRHAMDDYEKKIAFLKNDPVTSQMDAVKNDRIIVMKSLSMDPTLYLFDGIDTLITNIDNFIDKKQ